MLPTISSKDWIDINFGIAKGVDFVAISFVRTTEVIKHLMSYIRARSPNGDPKRKLLVLLEVAVCEKKEMEDSDGEGKQRRSDKKCRQGKTAERSTSSNDDGDRQPKRKNGPLPGISDETDFPSLSASRGTTGNTQVLLDQKVTFLQVVGGCQVLVREPNNNFKTVLQLINEDAEMGKLVLIEDSDSDSYVAIGEVMASDYSPKRIRNARGAAGQHIRVILKSVTKPDTILPFKVRSSDGKVICRTLGEAFSRKKGVMWLISDTVLTQPDVCTVVTREVGLSSYAGDVFNCFVLRSGYQLVEFWEKLLKSGECI